MEPSPMHEIQRNQLHNPTGCGSGLFHRREQQVTATINYYMTNAKIMKEGLQNCGLTVYGGDNAPYLWLKTPDSSPLEIL